MTVDPSRVEKTYKQLQDDAEKGGYHLNPDKAWTTRLVEGLLTNTDRYGYQSCPCRLASGEKKKDLDIICPCDYRDPDLNDYGACYCALYVSGEVASGQKEAPPVPERRPAVRPDYEEPTPTEGISVWRCRVCGYLCAREEPPEVCPICKAKKDRFERFTFPKSSLPA
jgi:ferredoxin-thioredoxin reductase catalytic chain